MARPASVDSAQLQHSSSCSPEDLINNQEENGRQQDEGSMTLPTKLSCDWSLKFGKIASKEEAKRYHGIFKVRNFLYLILKMEIMLKFGGAGLDLISKNFFILNKI